MDLRALEIFVAVAEANSMTGAAARLGLSQSGVSQAIKHVEEDLGVMLIDRSVRPSALTEAGHELYSRAHRILAEVGETAYAVRRAARVGAVRLRVGLVDSIAASIGPPLAHYLRESGGGCQLLSGQSAMHAEALRRRELDLVISSDDTLVHQPGLAVYPLVSESMILALPADYPRPKADVARLIDDLELVRYSERAAMGRQIALYFNRLRLAPRSTLAFDSSDAVMAMVGAGLGFAVTTPLCVLQGRARLRNVRLTPLAGSALRRHLSIGRHDGELEDLAKDIGTFSLRALRRDALPAIRELGEWMLQEIRLLDEGDTATGPAPASALVADQ